MLTYSFSFQWHNCMQNIDTRSNLPRQFSHANQMSATALSSMPCQRYKILSCQLSSICATPSYSRSSKLKLSHLWPVWMLKKRRRIEQREGEQFNYFVWKFFKEGGRGVWRGFNYLHPLIFNFPNWRDLEGEQNT